MILYPISKGELVAIDEPDLDAVAARRWYLVKPFKTAYASTDMRGRTVPMHRLLLGLDGAGRAKQVDHINGNGLDNRRCNLRVCTASQNQANRRRLTTNKSGYRGVCRVGANWQAGIKEKTTGSIHLGWFKTPEEAARAYDAAAKEIFGEFALLNFPHNLRGVSRINAVQYPAEEVQ